MLARTHSVALLAEGVDRNRAVFLRLSTEMVALLAEGVDRNMEYYEKLHEKYRSPSSRRAWIEIYSVTPFIQWT